MAAKGIDQSQGVKEPQRSDHERNRRKRVVGESAIRRRRKRQVRKQPFTYSNTLGLNSLYKVKVFWVAERIQRKKWCRLPLEPSQMDTI